MHKKKISEIEKSNKEIKNLKELNSGYEDLKTKHLDLYTKTTEKRRKV